MESFIIKWALLIREFKAYACLQKLTGFEIKVIFLALH